MREIKFRVWHTKEKKMYFRGYQKLSHILLCHNDEGQNEGKGLPVKKGSFEECMMLEGTGIEDINGQEIYEGDIVEILDQERSYQGTVESIPDMFRSRGLHPLQSLLEKYDLADKKETLQYKILGNVYEQSAEE